MSEQASNSVLDSTPENKPPEVTPEEKIEVPGGDVSSPQQPNNKSIAEEINDKVPQDLILQDGWIDKLPEEIREEPSLRNFGDVASLAKSLVHAQKQLGKNKVAVPGEKADKAEWDEFFKKVGMPEDPAQYKVGVDPDEQYLPEDIYNKIKQAAVENNILPSQAKAIFEAIKEINVSKTEDSVKKANEQYESALDTMKKKWGDAFDQNVQNSLAAIRAFGGENSEEVEDFIKSSGLANNPIMLEFLNNVSKTLDEDQVPAITPKASLTIDEAQQELDDMMASGGDYYSSDRSVQQKAMRRALYLREYIDKFSG